MTILDLDQFAIDQGTTNRDDLLLALRYRYGTTAPIISLASTTLTAKDPETVEFFDRELAWHFDDLGNCFLDCWDGVRHAIENGLALATKPTTGDMRGMFAGLPAVVVGAGPGVNARWDAIKASRGHAVLIVCDVMLEACLSRGIVPDFISTSERTPEVYETMVGMAKEGITLLAPGVIEKRVVDDFSGRVIWCWRGCGLENWIDPTLPRNNFGRSCGVQAVSVALLAGCSPIYMVGFDMCMDGDQTHAAGAHSETNQCAERLDRDEYHIRSPAKSISGRDVTTTHLWKMFQTDLNYIIRETPGQTVVNTGDGLMVRGTSCGEMPEAWGLPITIPTIQRETPGKDRRTLIPLMRLDIPNIEKRCREVMESPSPEHQKLKLTTMVGPETAQVWTEIYNSTYSGALIRIHLQPHQQAIMLKRVANIAGGLDAIQNP